MTTKRKSHVRLCVRAQRIQAEIVMKANGAGLSAWDVGFLKCLVEDMVVWGSPSQIENVERIEKKVFTDAPAA